MSDRKDESEERAAAAEALEGAEEAAAEEPAAEPPAVGGEPLVDEAGVEPVIEEADAEPAVEEADEEPADEELAVEVPRVELEAEVPEVPDEDAEFEDFEESSPEPPLRPPVGPRAARLHDDADATDTIDVEPEHLDALASQDVDLSDEELASLVGEIPWEGASGLVVAVAGGKGGAGRSLLAANIGLFLARLGRDVVVADLDPNGSNLHSYLGLEPLLPRPGVLLRDPGPPRFEGVMGSGLRLCRPPWSLVDAADPLRREALNAAVECGADVALLDLGCQPDALTLDTFLDADAGVVVVVPEPTSIERSYAFLRAALYRRLLHGDDEPAVVARALLAADQVGQLDTPADLVSALHGVHPNAAEAIRARVLAFTPRLLMNKCRTRADREMTAGLVSALRRRWGISSESLGGIEFDESAWEATRRRRPLMVEYPGSTFGTDIERVARRLVATMGREMRL